MTTPFDPAQPQELQPTPSRKGRTVVLVGGILALVGLGAGGAFAWQQVGGGGAQPESVLPSTTIAFAKVDLDPAGGQKLDAIRFARKFPEAKKQVREDSDLREVIIKGLQKDEALEGVDYARDVEPWLGKRLGFGLVPGKDADSKPVPVVALSVTDKDAARKSLPKLAGSLDGECQVLDAYALCTEQGNGQLAAVVSAAQKSSLSDNATFTKDMGDLGEDGIAAAWFDASKLSKAMGDLDTSGLMALPTKANAAGHGAYALRFDGPNLELAGHVNGLSTEIAAGSTGSTGLSELPKDTLAAVGVANAGEQLRTAWPGIEKSLKSLAGEQEFADGLAQAQDALGITLPEDVFKALGTQLTIAFGGMGEGHSDPQVAIVTDGDRAVLQKLADLGGEQAMGAPLTLKQAGNRSVLALSDGYADTVASGSGLADSETFKAALPDAAKAKFAAYADIAGLVAEFKDEASPEQTRDLAPLAAFGVTATGTGDHAEFRMRLTTR
jgi:Protein of unknown function (DUF3352)